jgi:hypothetical protein
VTAFDAAGRVTRGALLLDECMPGWDRHIDLDVLYVGSGTFDVPGQLCGSYWDGVDLLFGSEPVAEERHRQGVEHGFMWDVGRSEDPQAEAEALQDAWTDLITARRQERAA